MSLLLLVERALVSIAAVAALVPIGLYVSESSDRRIDRAVNLVSAKATCFELGERLRDQADQIAARQIGESWVVAGLIEDGQAIWELSREEELQLIRQYEEKHAIPFEVAVNAAREEFAGDLVRLSRSDLEDLGGAYSHALRSLNPFLSEVHGECLFIEQLSGAASNSKKGANE